MPILFVVFVSCLIYCLALLLSRLPAIFTETLVTDQTLGNCLLYKVRQVGIVLDHELEQVFHLVLSPVRELALNVRVYILKRRCYTKLVSFVPQDLCIVLCSRCIFKGSDLADSRVPEKHSKNRLIADPALVLRVSKNCPLS